MGGGVSSVFSNVLANSMLAAVLAVNLTVAGDVYAGGWLLCWWVFLVSGKDLSWLTTEPRYLRVGVKMFNVPLER